MAVMLAMLVTATAWGQEECQEQYLPGEFGVILDTGEFQHWYFADFPAIEDPAALEAEMWAWAEWIETLEGVYVAAPNYGQCLA